MNDLIVWTADDKLRRRARRIFQTAFLLLLAFTLGACDALEDVGLSRADNVQIGMLEKSGYNHTRARFHTLRGRKAWRETLTAGDTLALTYEATLEKGTLTIQIENPEGDPVWEVLVTNGEPVADAVELTSSASGTYTIALFGADAGGSYALAWETGTE